MTGDGLGYSVITADNGARGHELLMDEKPDLLVLDVMMKTNLEGYNLLHKIKGDPVWDFQCASKLLKTIIAGSGYPARSVSGQNFPFTLPKNQNSDLT